MYILVCIREVSSVASVELGPEDVYVSLLERFPLLGSFFMPLSLLTYIYMYMRISENHNSLGCEQPPGLDANQLLIAQDVIRCLISCMYVCMYVHA